MHTIENNKLLAEFMECEIAFGDTSQPCIMGKQNAWTPIKYNSDWNWLMEVVEKIESLNYSTSIENIIGLGHYFRIYLAGADVIEVRDYKTKIKAVYNGCVKFVKWHNQQKQ